MRHSYRRGGLKPNLLVSVQRAYMAYSGNRLFLGLFIVVISVISGKMVPIFVYTIFMVEFVHLIYIDKNKNDEAEDGALLCHPEAKFKPEEPDIIQNIDKQDRHSEGNHEPDG